MTAIFTALAQGPGLAPLLAGDTLAVEPKVIERCRREIIIHLQALWAKDGNRSEPHVDPRLALGQAQVLILKQIATGPADHLRELLPEIVYLAVWPYGGHEEAMRQARLARQQEGVAAASP